MLVLYMQIVRGGKVSWLHGLLVIRGKTFAVVQQFETPYNTKEKIRWKPSRLEANPREPRKFSTTNDLHYTIFKSRDQHERNGNWILHTSKHAIKFILIEKSHLKPTSNNINDIALILTK